MTNLVLSISSCWNLVVSIWSHLLSPRSRVTSFLRNVSCFYWCCEDLSPWSVGLYYKFVKVLPIKSLGLRDLLLFAINQDAVSDTFAWFNRSCQFPDCFFCFETLKNHSEYSLSIFSSDKLLNRRVCYFWHIVRHLGLVVLPRGQSINPKLGWSTRSGEWT